MNDTPTDHTLSGYIFPLPEELIAQEPATRRDASRLMVLNRATGTTQSSNFTDILSHLPEGCLLVANNSRVIPARLHGSRASGGKVEFLLLTPLPLLAPQEVVRTSAMSPHDSQETVAKHLERGPHSATWLEAEAEGLLKSSKQVRVGETVTISPDLHLEVRERGEFGRCRVLLRWQGDLAGLMARHGSLPLPPYIRRPAGEADTERYQTTYARADKAGSVAAPTAGLHFTPEIRAALAASGREWTEVTLYVGYGTFSPVRCEDIREHPMHAEYVEIPQATVQAIARAKAEGRAVIAVGTTSARVMEGVWGEGVWKESETCAQQRPESAPATGHHSESDPASSASTLAYAGWVNCFLYPGKDVHVINGIITNFHLPGSSLLMLVAALTGREAILNAYAQAVQERFRFFSYGDAMLIV